MYNQPYPNLFKPIKLRNMTVKNRIMSAPNMLFHTVDNRPTDYYIRYIEHKARGGAGIVTVGEACVLDGGNHTPWMEPTLDNLPLYAEMAAAIHEHGAIANIELTHGGNRIKPQFNRTDKFLGPGAMLNANGANISAMTKDDMEYVANGFADATEYYLTAGFDTVLLHYAHGWLFSQFMSPLTNDRTDEFGGSWENRIRFPLMVLKRVRERVGDKQPLCMRLSGSERRPDGFSVDDIIVFLQSAQQYVDMAEISAEEVTNFFANTYMPHAVNSDLSEAIKNSGKVNIPIYTLGSVLSPGEADIVISSGKADGVSMSRALIADPYLPKKAISSRDDEIRPCLRCLNCTDSDNLTRHFVCSVNPLIARENRLGFADTTPPANVKKKVLVAGGGPAGMQAAITAALQGHDVTLCEASDALGGRLRFTEVDNLKKDLRAYVEYLERGVKNHRVRVMLNTKVTDELVDTLSPDAIIIATGSMPVIPKYIKGIKAASHATAVYDKPGMVRGDSVVIIGGGLIGIETGIYLASLGKKVTILEMQNEYAADAKFVYKFGLVRQVNERGLNVITGAKCKEIQKGGVIYEKDGADHTVQGDTILYAVGMVSDEETYFDLYNKAPYVVPVGDCLKVGKVDGAIHSAYFAAMDIGIR